MTSAIKFLEAAAGHMRNRAATYDRPEGERSMAATVTAFNAITRHALTEAEGWLLLQLLKDVRQFQRQDYHADSAEDCIAYAALKAEALSNAGRLEPAVAAAAPTDKEPSHEPRFQYDRCFRNDNCERNRLSGECAKCAIFRSAELGPA